MPQLDSGGGGAGGGDDLGAPDELLAFQDEGEEQDDKSRDNAAGPERDLAELKSSLVNESEGAAGGAGVPGSGAGARGEAEVGAEVSAGLCTAPPLWPPLGPRLALTHPSLPRLSQSPSLRTPPVPGPQLSLRPSRPLCISPQALGREHTSQRLFPDKLPEPLEDGEFLHRLAPLHPQGPGLHGREGAEVLPPQQLQLQEAVKPRGWECGGRVSRAPPGSSHFRCPDLYRSKQTPAISASPPAQVTD